MSIKIIIGDDHTVIREGIEALIKTVNEDIEIIGEASNGEELLKLAESRPADVYVVDISMPILNGIETTDRLVKRDPKSKVIIFSMHDDHHMVEKAFQCGAKGYLLKRSSAFKLLSAIHEIYNGGHYIDEKISGFIINRFINRSIYKEKTDDPGILSGREKEILQLISEGFSNKEISDKLNISLHTVQFHRNNIMKKLGIHKQAELIRYAIKEGIAQL